MGKNKWIFGVVVWLDFFVKYRIFPGCLKKEYASVALACPPHCPILPEECCQVSHVSSHSLQLLFSCPSRMKLHLTFPDHFVPHIKVCWRALLYILALLHPVKPSFWKLSLISTSKYWSVIPSVFTRYGWYPYLLLLVCRYQVIFFFIFSITA